MDLSSRGNLRYLIESRLARCDEMKHAKHQLSDFESEAWGLYDPCEVCRAVGNVPLRDSHPSRRPSGSHRLPEGLRLPDDTPHPPNLFAANLSFAARVVIAVRDRFAGDAPAVYRAAKTTRQAYSQIVSDETHKVDKKTALRFCFALKCTVDEANRLLKSAGFAFSNANRRDCVLQACLEAVPPVWNLDDVNLLLREYRVDFQF